jgi:hypothetical protein
MRNPPAIPDDRSEIAQPVVANRSEIAQEIARRRGRMGQYAMKFSGIGAARAISRGQKIGKIRSEQRFFAISSGRSLRRSIEFDDARP